MQSEMNMKQRAQEIIRMRTSGFCTASRPNPRSDFRQNKTLYRKIRTKGSNVMNKLIQIGYFSPCFLGFKADVVHRRSNSSHFTDFSALRVLSSHVIVKRKIELETSQAENKIF